jgi:hypothetical protein
MTRPNYRRMKELRKIQICGRIREDGREKNPGYFLLTGGNLFGYMIQKEPLSFGDVFEKTPKFFSLHLYFLPLLLPTGILCTLF